MLIERENVERAPTSVATATGPYVRIPTARSRESDDPRLDKVRNVITGLDENGMGDEDVACADYLEALLQGHQPAPEPFLTRVRESVIGQLFLNPSYPELPADDLPCCTDLDRFDFAMLVRRKNDLLVMKPAQ